MKGSIQVKGIEVFAYHGVYDFEKEQGQKFYIDVRFDVSLTSCDDISTTIDYGVAADEAKEYALAHRCDLLETLASGMARMFACKYGTDVTITVHKPQAPLSMPFSDALVSAEAVFTDVCLGIGSNMGDKKAYLDYAVDFMKSIAENKDVQVSDYIVTKPYGVTQQDDFLNACMRMRTILSPRELLGKCAEAEKGAGRVRNLRWGPRTLDVDILLYGDRIISEKDLTIPHADMKNRIFVLEPLAQIAGGMLHPVYRKTVSDMLAEKREQ